MLRGNQPRDQIPGQRFIDPGVLTRIDNLELIARGVVDGFISGLHRSPMLGMSVDFAEHRSYMPGDDVRRVDWRLFARTDRLYLRTYEQETSMDCHIFLDCSASMGFGANLTKLEYASFFAASLAYLVTRNTDRASLLLFDEELRTFLPPGSTTRHLHNELNVLERNEPGNRTSLSAALRKAYPLFPHRGAMVVISDFFDDPLSAPNILCNQLFNCHSAILLASSGASASVMRASASMKCSLPGKMSVCGGAPKSWSITSSM